MFSIIWNLFNLHDSISAGSPGHSQQCDDCLSTLFIPQSTLNSSIHANELVSIWNKFGSVVNMVECKLCCVYGILYTYGKYEYTWQMYDKWEKREAGFLHMLTLETLQCQGQTWLFLGSLSTPSWDHPLQLCERYHYFTVMVT